MAVPLRGAAHGAPGPGHEAQTCARDRAGALASGPDSLTGPARGWALGSEVPELGSLLCCNCLDIREDFGLRIQRTPEF